ncbi:MAG: GntR family transcriptional regulator [Armatimonadota bacterium]|nr:GntR family transcriptional regulator [Armatimonadota bacterium]
MSRTSRPQLRTLDGGGPIPLHRQLRDVLVQEIARGRYRPGERILSERELCLRYGVSRTTVRQTVNDLVHSGQLIRVPAKGTFVAAPIIEQDLERVSRFSETVAASGRTPTIRLLATSRGPASEPVRRGLELSAGDETIRIDVLGAADNEPLVLYRVHLPAIWGATVVQELRDAEAAGGARFDMILRHLKRVYGLAPAWAVQRYEAATADTAAAALLGIGRGAAVFTSTRIVYTGAGVPIEYDEVLYRGDRYRFTIRRAYTI